MAELLRASCGLSTDWAFRYPRACLQIIKSAFNPQERDVIEDNPQDTKPSLSKNDPNFELLVKLVSQLFWFVLSLLLEFLLRGEPPNITGGDPASSFFF